MKTLMSQSEFARHMSTPTKRVTQQMVNKYIKQGKLPAQGNKLIMPDAEKAYHIIQAGVINVTTYDNDHYLQDNKIHDPEELTLERGKWYEYKFNNQIINLTNDIDSSDIEVRNDQFISTNVNIGINCVAGITFRSANYFGFEVVNDSDYDEVLPIRQDVEGFGKDYFLLKESELINLIKNRKTK